MTAKDRCLNVSNKKFIKMSSGFVKTSVLEIGDGGSFHGGETRIESDDVKKQEYRNQQQSSRPLYEQLEDEKDKKQAEYDAVTKMMFAPTKALDEEEAQHFNDVEERKRNDRKLLHMQEESELDSFKFARLNKTFHLNNGTTQDTNVSLDENEVSVAPPPKARKAPTLNTKIKVKKRKTINKSEISKPDDTIKSTTNKQQDSESKTPSEQKNNPLSLLGDYDSDDD